MCPSCKGTINQQSKDSLVSQQHASGQFSAIKPCLRSFSLRNINSGTWYTIK